MKEVLIIGSYQQSDQLQRFITETQATFHILIRYCHPWLFVDVLGSSLTMLRCCLPQVLVEVLGTNHPYKGTGFLTQLFFRENQTLAEILGNFQNIDFTVVTFIYINWSYIDVNGYKIYLISIVICI